MWLECGIQTWMLPNTMNHLKSSQEKTGEDSRETARAQWMSEMRTKEGNLELSREDRCRLEYKAASAYIMNHQVLLPPDCAKRTVGSA